MARATPCHIYTLLVRFQLSELLLTTEESISSPASQWLKRINGFSERSDNTSWYDPQFKVNLVPKVFTVWP